MKIKHTNALMAILDLTIEMSANQKAFQEMMISSICETDDKYDEVLKAVSAKAKDNTVLIRAKLLQYSEISENDLLNGQFEV